VIAPGVAFQDLAAQHLTALVEDEASEGRNLDFKEALPGNSDRDKREFLADVSSFANAGGGDLLFGIREAGSGVAEAVVPLQFNPDTELLRLEQFIRTAVTPRIPGLRMREIAVNEGFGLIMRIPASWEAPHAVTYQGSQRFYSRNSRGKFELDVQELRNAFLASSAAGTAIRNFRTERLGRIAASGEPISTEDVGKIVLHLVPYGALTTQQTFELNVIRGSGLFRPGFEVAGGDERWNIDGLLTYSLNREQNAAWSYTQLFRDGCLEAVDAFRLRPIPDQPGGLVPQPAAGGHSLEALILRGTANHVEVLRRIGVEPPIVVFVSLLGVENLAIVTGDPMADAGGIWRRIDRETLLLPEVLLESEDVDVIREMRPIADSLWQASGWNWSSNYDAEGNWTARA
jgi:hypothetical protein